MNKEDKIDTIVKIVSDLNDSEIICLINALGESINKTYFFRFMFVIIKKRSKITAKGKLFCSYLEDFMKLFKF